MEYLEMVLYWLLCAFGIAIFLTFWSNFIEQKPYKPYIKTLIIVSWISLTTFINSLGIPTLNLCFGIGGNIIICLILYDATIKSRLFYATLASIIAMGVDIISEILWTIITNKHSLENVQTNEYNIFFLFFLTKLCTYIILRIIVHFKGKSTRNIDNRTFIAFMTFPISSGVILFGIGNSNILATSQNLNKIILLIGGVFLLFSNLWINYWVQRYMNILNEQKKTELSNLKTSMQEYHYRQLETINEEHSHLLHNYNKHIRVIGSLVKTGNAQEIEKVINDLNIEMSEINKIQYCNNSILNAILCERKSKAEELNIEYEVNVNPNITLQKFSDFDIISITSNLLDNAIEASSKCNEKKFIKVNISMSNNYRFLVIQVINSYAKKLRKENGHYITTKTNPQNHGIGIKNIEKTAKKYSGIVTIEPTDNKFSISVFLSIN